MSVRLTKLVGLIALITLAACSMALAEASHEGWPAFGHHHGHPNNESGTMRAYTLEGVSSLGLPTITVLYEVSPDYVTIHAAQFSEALHRDAGRG